MKQIIIILIVPLFFYCGSRDQTIPSSEEEYSGNLVVQKSNNAVALQFINDYIEYTRNPREEWNLVGWVNSSELTTQEFKDALEYMVERAKEENGAIGLGFDPIVDAQDHPKDGFELESFDGVNNYLIVRGIDWPDFKVAMRIKDVRGKWLVDGCGVVNIPKERRVER